LTRSLATTLAAAGVQRIDVVLAGVKSPMHRHHLIDGRLNRRGFMILRRPRIEERGVALHLEQGKVRGSVDHGLEQPGHHVLGMGQARPM
jgi:hypothetical protein